MQLLFVSDGPRDAATIPEIVRTILNTLINVEFVEWKRIQLARGSGYRRKLRFALLRARDHSLDGVVATVDRDTAEARARLLALSTAREEDRNDPGVSPMPAAIGEAVPNTDAWLLDDAKALRTVLCFVSDTPLPSVRQGDPKFAIDELINESTRTDDMMYLLAEIARNIVPDRCNHSDKTGFEEFLKDVRDELLPLVTNSS
jgi:hypothetical protein